MLLLGITGGIGAGKSTTCLALSEFGIPWIDTDQVARDQTAPGTGGLNDIVREFGPEVLDSRGELRRDSLARIVFGNPDGLRRLEGILHPRISRVWRDQVSRWKAAGLPVGAVIIPLLFEKGYEPDFGRTICLGCTRRTQFDRLRRRSWTEEQIEARVRAQLPLAEKMSRADFVIWTEGTLPLHQRQWRRILKGDDGTTCSPV
ncbi:MAG: dephospho-CoA kinase [Verrucomicrobiales bacterium]|nr:dephospho-CoA kinase [Verrucomicrobiales bacterium]